MNADGKNIFGHPKTLVDIERNPWGGWSLYPVNKTARDLFECRHPRSESSREDSTAAKSPEIPARTDCRDLESGTPETLVCEPLRGIDGATGKLDQVSPETSSGACLECNCGNFGTYADARRAAARNFWRIVGDDEATPLSASEAIEVWKTGLLMAGLCGGFWGTVAWLLIK